MITAEELRLFLDYDPLTGDFVWIKSTGKRNFKGFIAGRTDARGYRGINIKGRKYAAHRLAWLWMTGEWPSAQIDHIDRNPGNNRFSNLRDVSGSTNCRNRKPVEFAHKGKTKGITYHKKRKKWQATICLPGSRNLYLGLFSTPEEASAAYQAALHVNGIGDSL